VDEIIEMVHDHVVLATRVAAGESLVSPDRAHLLALTRLLPGTGAAPEPTDDDDPDDGLPAQLTTRGGFAPARLAAISRDGMRVYLADPRALGPRTAVRLIAARAGLEYVFPCWVAWRGDAAAGLLFDGTPTRTRLSKAMRVGWRQALPLATSWGAPPPVARPA
jgi:hypothetical protein